MRILEHRLGLQRLHESASQGKHQTALLVQISRFGDGCGFLGLVTPQLALVLAFVQVTNGGRNLCARERPVDSLIASELGPIRRESEVRIGTQIGCDLGGPRLVNVELRGFQGRVRGLELVLNLLPGERGLSRERSDWQSREDNHHAMGAPEACVKNACARNAIPLPMHSS